jgi:hypothetical protein
MPGRGKGPGRQTVPELWSAIISQPIFGGLLLGATLCAILEGTPRAGQGTQFWPLLLVGGFLGVGVTLVPVFYLRELVRRRAWVPSGAARFPTLVAISLSALLMAVGVAGGFAVIGIVGTLVGQLLVLESSPLMIGVSICGLGFTVIGSVYLVKRLIARISPATVEAGAREPNPPWQGE